MNIIYVNLYLVLKNVKILFYFNINMKFIVKYTYKGRDRNPSIKQTRNKPIKINKNYNNS